MALVGSAAYDEQKKTDFWEKIQMPIAQALVPVQHLETQWSPAELQKRVVNHVYKQMLKFDKDERLENFATGGGCNPGAILHEFVEAVMSAIAYSCYDKQWFGQVDFTGPLYAASLVVFKGRNLFRRTTGARFQGWIVEAFNRWNEDQRIEKVMSDTVQAAGLSDHAQKEMTKQLAKAYDQAHHETTLIAPECENPEMAMLQEFISFWYKQFVVTAWRTLCSSVQGGRDGQMAFTSALFQTLSSPDVNCLPNDLTAPLDGPKMLEAWQEIADNIEHLYSEAEAKAKGGGNVYQNTWSPSAAKKKKAPPPMQAPQPLKLMNSPDGKLVDPASLMPGALPALPGAAPSAAPQQEESLGPLY